VFMLLFRFLILVMTMLAAGVSAETATIRVPSAVPMDKAGQTLRRAFNGYERALIVGLPQAWSQVSLPQGAVVEIDADHRLLLAKATAREAEVLHLHGAESTTLKLVPGATLEAGELSLVLTSTNSTSVRLMVRATRLTPAFQDARPAGGSRVAIDNFSGSVLTIGSVDARDLRFAERFLKDWFGGLSEADALATAWKAYPPARIYSAPVAAEPYVDPTNIIPSEAEGPGDVTVTLTSILADSAAFGSLQTAIAYRSDGADRGGVRAGMSGAGVQAGYGQAGDRFRAALSALEQSGSVRERNETILRIPLYGEGSFSIQGGGIASSGIVGARVQGARITLDFSLRGSGNVTRSSVSLRPGQTVLVTRHQSSRTETHSSGPPLVGGIPFVGPALGNSSRSSGQSEWALYATVERE
jgi:hypothetical protein